MHEQLRASVDPQITPGVEAQMVDPLGEGAHLRVEGPVGVQPAESVPRTHPEPAVRARQERRDEPVVRGQVEGFVSPSGNP